LRRSRAAAPWNLALNTKVAPWSDVHARRAVAYAIDRSGLVTALGGPAVAAPALTMITPSQLRLLGSQQSVHALLESLPTYPFSVAKGKAELARSATPNGFTATLYSTGFEDTLNEAIAGELGKIGIDLKLQSEDFGTWIGNLTGPRDKFTIGIIPYGCTSPDPSYYPGALLGSKNAVPGEFNDADYTPAKMDALLAAALATTSKAKRLALYGQILKLVGTDVPYVPLLTFTSGYAISNKFKVTGFNYFRYVEGPWALDIRLR
jgi:peptide/nickel transport system substrate-binding protein